MPPSDRPRRSVGPSWIVQQREQREAAAASNKEAAELRRLVAVAKKSANDDIRRQKDDERRAKARETEERKLAKAAEKAAEAELKRAEKAAKQAQLVEEQQRKQDEHAAREQLRLQAAAARSAEEAAEARRKSDEFAAREQKRRDAERQKYDEAKRKRLPRSASDGGCTADDAVMLHHICMAAKMVSDERAAFGFADMYAPLHAEPPSEPAIAFATVCRLGTSTFAAKVAKTRTVHADQVYVACAVNGDTVEAIAAISVPRHAYARGGCVWPSSRPHTVGHYAHWSPGRAPGAV